MQKCWFQIGSKVLTFGFGIKSRSYLRSPELEADGLQTPPRSGLYKILPANTGANHGTHVQFIMQSRSGFGARMIAE